MSDMTKDPFFRDMTEEEIREYDEYMKERDIEFWEDFKNYCPEEYPNPEFNY